MPIDPEVSRLATGANYATVVTLMPGGQPQAQITWVDADDEDLLVNTEEGRQRTRNLHRDPRITVLVRSETDPYDFVEVRGRVVEFVGGRAARDHIDALSHKYDGCDYGRPIGPGGRVILKIAPDKVLSYRNAGHPSSDSEA